ncbi:MAG TPA: iron-containing alcohol dehydrogenase [Verrucomicrobiae bacterium]|jgi:alcohol dehydrogenase class IV|nr:iron-containing alcohol dehydrogenase [Verrucomicrobiae bacterium]
MKFEFATANRIVFGAGVAREAGKLARSLGSRALLVTGSNPQRAAPILHALTDAGVSANVFPVAHEPSIDLTEAATAQARAEKCDVIIGYGGGSALDAAKAVAALLGNGGSLLDYVEIIGKNKPLARPSLPCLAIPTTSGTGSEVTRNSVLSSHEHKLKVSLRSPYLLPAIALVDPLLTHSLPPAITTFTGMDALTQLIEPWVCQRANPVTDAFCREGIGRVRRSLRVAVQNGQDASAREDMSVASLLGGLALTNAGLGAVHGLAGPIGGMFDAPHGALCGLLLPAVIRMNRQALRARAPQHPALKRLEELAWVEDFAAEFSIPPLSSYGVEPGHFSAIAEKALQTSSMKANPIQLSKEELIEILSPPAASLPGSALPSAPARPTA